MGMSAVGAYKHPHDVMTNHMHSIHGTYNNGYEIECVYLMHNLMWSVAISKEQLVTVLNIPEECNITTINDYVADAIRGLHETSKQVQK